MTRRIAVVSGKGGVGKSTTVANLGIALAQFGRDVTVIDANFTTPDLTLHFGSPTGTPTLHHVMAGEFELEEAIHVHPSGLKIIPASIAIPDMKKTKYSRLDKIVRRIGGDFVLMDTQAGLNTEVLSVIAACDEVLIVTNPEWPAITDALKASLVSKEQGANVIGVILNRVNQSKIEPNMKGIEAILETPIIGVVPEDHSVRVAIAMRNPVVVFDPHSDASIAFKQIAARLAGVEYHPPNRFLRKIKRILRKLVR